MEKLVFVLCYLGLLFTSCADNSELTSTEVAYDAAVLAVSVRIANEAYDASGTQTCGNASHNGIQNLQVTVFNTSDARSENGRKVVAAGLTSNRGSVVFKNMTLGQYTVSVSSGDVTLEKDVPISEKKRIGVIMDF